MILNIADKIFIRQCDKYKFIIILSFPIYLILLSCLFLAYDCNLFIFYTNHSHKYYYLHSTAMLQTVHSNLWTCSVFTYERWVFGNKSWWPNVFKVICWVIPICTTADNLFLFSHMFYKKMNLKFVKFFYVNRCEL